MHVQTQQKGKSRPGKHATFLGPQDDTSPELAKYPYLYQYDLPKKGLVKIKNRKYDPGVKVPEWVPNRYRVTNKEPPDRPQSLTSQKSLYLSADSGRYSMEEDGFELVQIKEPKKTQHSKIFEDEDNYSYVGQILRTEKKATRFEDMVEVGNASSTDRSPLKQKSDKCPFTMVEPVEEKKSQVNKNATKEKSGKRRQKYEEESKITEPPTVAPRAIPQKFVINYNKNVQQLPGVVTCSCCHKMMRTVLKEYVGPHRCGKCNSQWT